MVLPIETKFAHRLSFIPTLRFTEIAAGKECLPTDSE